MAFRKRGPPAGLRLQNISDAENASNAKRLLGVPEFEAPLHKGRADSVKKSIRDLFNKYFGERNFSKQSQKTTFYRVKPLSPDVSEELSGETLYIKLLVGIPIEYMKKEAEINMALSGNSYVSEMLAYEIYSNKIGLFLFRIPPGQTLKEYIHQIQQVEKKCSPRRYFKIIGDLIQGLNYIHSQGYLHRDIKPDNIYVPSDPAMPAYYLDFGESSTLEGENRKNYRLRGTFKYAKPNKQEAHIKAADEAFGYEYVYDASDDIFALGIVVDKLVANCAPDVRKSLKDYFDAIVGQAGAAGGAPALAENSEGLVVENVLEPGFGMVNIPPVLASAGAGGKKTRMEMPPLSASGGSEGSQGFVIPAMAGPLQLPKWDPSKLSRIKEAKENGSEGGRRRTRRSHRRKTHRRIR
jgi:serine/threonine protein kinase